MQKIKLTIIIFILIICSLVVLGNDGIVLKHYEGEISALYRGENNFTEFRPEKINDVVFLNVRRGKFELDAYGVMDIIFNDDSIIDLQNLALVKGSAIVKSFGISEIKTMNSKVISENAEYRIDATKMYSIVQVDYGEVKVISESGKEMNVVKDEFVIVQGDDIQKEKIERKINTYYYAWPILIALLMILIKYRNKLIIDRK